MTADDQAVRGAQVVRVRADADDAVIADRVAVEAPLELRINGAASTVLMRTPGHDEELVSGFLYSEGLIARADELLAIDRPPGLTGDELGNVIAVRLAATATPPSERLFYASSSCGVCGKNSIAGLAVRAPHARGSFTMARTLLHELPARLRAAQPAFAATGGLHASGLFRADGTLVAVREDVGRHNALDKLIGAALAAGELPLAERVLVVSGRVSYEILQKAIAAGVPVVAAVGAPSSLAIDLAEQFDVTLVGFLRDGGMNIYAGADKLG